MLTTNFYAGMAAFITRSYKDGKNRYGDVTSINVETLGDPGSGIKQSMLKPSLLYGSMCYGVFFGSGTTPPTVNDYGLESFIGTGLDITEPSAVSDNTTDDYWEMSVTYGIYASSDCTISEVGLFVTHNKSVDITRSVMIDRTVLENPIVIPAGQSKQVTYTIRINRALV